MSYISNPNSHRHCIYQSRCNRIFGTLIAVCIWLQLWNVLYSYQETSFSEMILYTVITAFVVLAFVGGLFIIFFVLDSVINWFMGY